MSAADPARFAEEWEIHRLGQLYARAMDRNEPAILGEIFSDDGMVEGPGFKIQGHTDLLGIPAMLKKQYSSTFHAVHNQTVTFDGDTASGETYCSAYHLTKTGEKTGSRLDWAIRYQDRFVRQNGRWRFSHRRLIVDSAQTVTVDLPHG